MSKLFSRTLPAATRAAFVSGLLLSVAGCSSEVSRLSQPFFAGDDVTGSLVPPEPIYGAGLSANSSSDTSYRPVSRGAISSAPLAPAPGTTASSGPISSRAQQPVQQASYNPPAQQPAYAPQPGYAAKPAYGQANNYPQRATYQQPVAAAPAPRLTPQPAPRGQVHTVASGETLYSISRNYDVPVNKIVDANRLDQPNNIRVGQKLTIPGTAVAAAPRPVRVAASNHIQTDAVSPVPSLSPARQGQTSSSGLQPRRVTTAPVSGAPRLATPQPPVISEQPAEQRQALLAPSRPPVVQKPQTQELPEPQGLAAGTFRWPARGRIISTFGSKPNGVQNDGINIAVPEGTSVKAAEAGVVAYVGNELKGYGNLILIRHGDDWVTAYAHNSEVLVRRGDTVQRGQIVAKAGRTGNVDQPQLHFEIRKGSKPQDPLQQLPST